MAPAIFIGWLIWPGVVHLPSYNWDQTAESEYEPAIGSCEPSEINKIRSDRERLIKRETCEQQAEQHRIDTNDLKQQTRAADAAAGAVVVAEWQARVTVIGLLVGLYTLIAAGFAAWFARNAVIEGKRIGEAQVRAYFVIEKVLACVESDAITMTVTVRNCGQSPAFDVRSTFLFYNPEIKRIHQSDYINTIGAQASEILAPERVEIELTKGFMTLSVEVSPIGMDVFDKKIIESGKYDGIINESNWGKPVKLHRSGMLVSAVAAEIAKRKRDGKWNKP